MLETLQFILVVLVLILMCLAALVANVVLKPERRTPTEWVEDRKIEKSKRAEQRAQDVAYLKEQELLRKVESYDGTIE